MRNFIFALVALFAAGSALAQGPSPGPGPVPSPWLVNGNTISYPGAVLNPSTVTGGSKGPGTYNAQNGYYEAGVRVSGLPPTMSYGMICNPTGVSTVPVACSWNTFASGAIGTVNNSMPFYTGGAWGRVTTGKSVGAPGTGTLENTLPPQTVTGTSKVFGTPDLFMLTRRTNSGTPMTDTFPAVSTPGLVNGTRITYDNTDSTAAATISAGAGTTMSSGLGTDTVGPGRSLVYTYDAAATQWRATSNSMTALLGPNNLSDLSSIPAARATLGLGSAALQNIGTSGANVPLLNAANTWSTAQVFPNSSIPNATLANSSITINGQSVSLGGSITVTATAAAVTVGTTQVNSGAGILWNASSGATLSAVALSNNGVLVTNGSGVPSIASALPSGVTGSSLTSVGTITGGVWQGTVVGGTYGGTGVNNGARTITVAGNLTTAAAFTQSGAFATTLTSTAVTNVTLPAGTQTLAALGLAQQWTAAQSYSSGTLRIQGASSGSLTINCASACGTNTLTFPSGTTDFSSTGGAGQFVKQASAGAPLTVVQPAFGDITGVVTNSQLATMPDGTIKANISGSTASPSDPTISQVLDKLLGSSRGTVAYRGLSGWSGLLPGVAGQFFTTQGSGADPNWSSGGAGTGTVTQVICGNGLSGGTITASGTCALSPPIFMGYLSANQGSVSSGTFTKVNINTVIKDSASWFNTSTNTYTPQLAGTYLVTVKVRCFGSTTADACIGDVFKNGTDYARGAAAIASGVGILDATTTVMVPMNGSTDTIQMFGYVTGSGALSFSGGTGPLVTYMAVQYVGP